MHGTALQNLAKLKTRYDALRVGKDALLRILEEAELPEAVYNSNAIENSTLTLDETERILLEQEMPAHHSQREVFEALNLGKVTEYLHGKVEKGEALTQEILLLAHRMLLSNISEKICGRFRQAGEYVRVGRHIAPAPEQIPDLIGAAFGACGAAEPDILQRILAFHLEFERIHPFCDGNGRVGRAVMNFQLKSAGYPPVIVRNKEKHRYYAALTQYSEGGATKEFERIIVVMLKESFHKRIAYLNGDEIVLLSEVAKEHPEITPQSLGNAAKKQALPAFRERGKWKVGRSMLEEWAGEKEE